MIEPNEQMAIDATDFLRHETNDTLLDMQVEGDRLRRKLDEQLDGLMVGVAVLWKVVEHGDMVVCHLTTEEWNWYDEFVLPKLKMWGKA